MIERVKAAPRAKPGPKPDPGPKLKPRPKPKPTAVTERATVERRPATEEPFLRFYQSPGLRKKTLDVLDRIESATDPTRHRMALADVIVELTRSGMDAYFMQPLKLSRAGFITEQSAGLGMAGAVQVIASVIRNIIGSMNAPQLISVSKSLRQFMR